MGEGGFEPPKPKQQIYSLPHLTALELSLFSVRAFSVRALLLTAIQKADLYEKFRCQQLSSTHGKGAAFSIRLPVLHDKLKRSTPNNFFLLTAKTHFLFAWLQNKELVDGLEPPTC